jgi:uncharacterized protein YbcI
MAKSRSTLPTSADEASRRLTEEDWQGGVETEDAGRGQELRAAITNVVVGLKKEFYGKGPTKAKTFVNENYVFCVMAGGLTRNEETLLAHGEHDLVRAYRLRFQEVMSEPTVRAIERVTGRTVIGYHSQIVFDPEHAFEIFVLDAAPDSAQA